MLSEHSSAEDARNELQGYKANAKPIPAGETITPVPGPRAAVPKRRRVIELLKRLRREGSEWSRLNLEEMFRAIDAASVLPVLVQRGLLYPCGNAWRLSLDAVESLEEEHCET